MKGHDQLMGHLINPAEAGFVVLDTETTGLSAEEDVVMEVGVTVTDINLNELITNSWLVKSPDWENKLFRNEFVQDMHTKNGLMADIRSLPDSFTTIDFEGKQQQGNYGPAFVSLQIWQWLRDDLGLDAGVYPMCGSSIGSLDRPFWKSHLPVAHSFFTYRSIDVSSIKELCKRWNPALYAEMLMLPEFSDANKNHRVRDDIKFSIRELKFYMDNFLKVNVAGPEVAGQLPLPV